VVMSLLAALGPLLGGLSVYGKQQGSLRLAARRGALMSVSTKRESKRYIDKPKRGSVLVGNF
jgi:hypothetical protein